MEIRLELRVPVTNINALIMFFIDWKDAAAGVP
jgi:hypothetical protein